MVHLLLTNKAGDARAAMKALIESRGLQLREDDAGFARAIAKLSWEIADAMAEEHMSRASGGDRPSAPRGKR